MSVSRTTRSEHSGGSGEHPSHRQHNSQVPQLSARAQAALVGLNHRKVIEEAAEVTGQTPEDIAKGLGEILDRVADNIEPNR